MERSMALDVDLLNQTVGFLQLQESSRWGIVNWRICAGDRCRRVLQVIARNTCVITRRGQALKQGITIHLAASQVKKSFHRAWLSISALSLVALGSDFR